MEGKKKFQPDQKLKLIDQVRQVLRYHHYSYRTEKTYCNWIIRFLKFYHLKIHPREMGKNEIEAAPKILLLSLTNSQNFVNYIGIIFNLDYIIN